MEIKPLFRDPVTGFVLEAQPSDQLNVTVQVEDSEYVTLMQDTEANTCCAIIEYTAVPVNSVNTPSLNFRNQPYVDCVILEAGREGDRVRAAITHGKSYTTPSSISYTTSDLLYLGRDSKVTTTPPSILNGDNWLTIVGRLVNHTEFIFDPQIPNDLNNPGGGGGGGSLPSPLIPNTFLFTDGLVSKWKSIKTSDIAPDPAISFFNPSNTTLEVGQSIVNPTFLAGYNESVISARIKDNQYNSWSVISIPTNFNSPHTYRLTSSGSVQFTLEVTLSAIITATCSISWLYKKYYGTFSSLTNITDLQYNSLVSSRSGLFTVTANTGEYIYLAIPASFGTPVFSVGGFVGGFTFDSTINFTNSYGVSVLYNIYKSDHHSLGLTTVQVN